MLIVRENVRTLRVDVDSPQPIVHCLARVDGHVLAADVSVDC